MASGIATIHVRRRHGKLIIQADGRTPRGKRFIRAIAPLKSESPSDPNFKKEMAAAVDEMLAQQLLPL